MKKTFTRILAAVLCAVMLSGIMPMDCSALLLDGVLFKASAASWGTSVVNGRDDGKWLFPVGESRYKFSDWAGCNMKNGCKCPFNCESMYNRRCHITCTEKSHSNHNGVDIPGTKMTVMAAADGVAYSTKSSLGSRGITLVIEHGIDNNYSYYSYYQHLSKVTKTGDVKAGEDVAVSGDSGAPGQWHLHFGIVIGQKGRLQEVANGSYLSTLESKGWITQNGLREGRIVTNPSLKSKKPGGYDSVKQHAGSVTYVFNKNEVTVKKSGNINIIDALKKLIEDITAPSKITIENYNYPSGNLPKGKSFGLSGDIISNKTLTDVSAYIINKVTGVVLPGYPKSVNPNSTYYSLKGKGHINDQVKFGSLTDGSYTYKVTATDEKGYYKNDLIISDFTIGNGGANTVPSPSMPTFTPLEAIPGGYRLMINPSDYGTIYYTTDGSDPATYGKEYVDIVTSPYLRFYSSCTLRAIAINGKQKSGEASLKINVPKVAQPTVTPQLTNNSMCVTIQCSTPGAVIYYTLDNGLNPTPNSSRYMEPIYLGYSTTIKAYAVKEGYSDSEVATASITAKAPVPPGIEIPTGDTVAIGDSVEVRWTQRADATSYKVRIYRDRKLVDTVSVVGSRYVYIPQTAGVYTFGVDAINFVGMASSDSTKSVTAKDPVTVRFVDIVQDADGVETETVLKEQTVRYGYSAAAPQTPKRKGWVFRDWENRNYLHATTDMTIKALWDREKYIVRFIDENGISISQQEVEYEGAAVLPPDPSNGLAGYKFMGWRTLSADKSSLLDYHYVDANLTLQPVFEWENPDLPIAVQSASATKTRKNDGDDHTVYTVSAQLNNFTQKSTFCRVLITLKTSTGKAIQTAVRDFHLKQGAVSNTFDSGEIICDKVVAKIEINVVGIDENGDKTGGAYSNSYTINSIKDEAGIYFTDWSPNRTYASSDEETKTMYRYRDKQYTTSSSYPLSGWTHYDTSVSYGAWSGNQSSTSYPGDNSDVLQNISNSTVYDYYHYCCNYYNGKNNVDSISCGSGSHHYHTCSRSSALPAFNMADKGGKQAYGGSGSGAPICMKNGWYAWFLKNITTTYVYQTRSKSYTYKYWAWGNWSNWIETPVYTGGDRQAEPTTYYRYKITPQTSTEGEDNSGTVYDSSNIRFLGTPGVLPNVAEGVDLAGRKANVIVYKASLNDPTANHIEYVGQITIGAGNTYDISFIPAQEPDEAESNFTIAIAVEGQTALFNIGTILCSKSKYEVEFFANGESLGKQLVDEGDNAEVPVPPEIPGKVFVGWNNDTTNIVAPRKIEAYYVDETYSVVFVDFETDYVSMDQYKYGEIIAVPAAGDIEGKTFLGWEGLDMDDPVATEHAVYIAKYETGTFTVKFDDGYGNILSTQTVEYGKAAELPDAPEKDGLVFMGWGQDQSWWNVKSDMIVSPIWVYEDTVAPVNVSVENLYFGGEITAETDTENATIYYAIDDGSGEPPRSLAQLLLERGDIDSEEIDLYNDDQFDQTLLKSPMKLAAGQDNNDEMDEEYDESSYDEKAWMKYDESIVLIQDATLYFYATDDDMNDSEIVTVDYKYIPVQNPYEDHTGETHTVVFLDDDGFVLSEQTVNYFEDAVAPEVEPRDGFVFVGWDSKFDHVTEDLEVTAQYVPEDEYVTFALDRDAVIIKAGETVALRCDVSNASDDMGEIIWKSSDDSVADVSIDGLVLANHAGEAVITAKCADYSASCKVTVLPNENDTVVLNSNSALSLENGMLTQIPIASNHNAATAGEIKNQLATPYVKLFDANGNELADSDPVTTNTQIRIIVDGIVIDAVIVIVTGDYDGNGKINNRDAAKLMRYLVHKETPNEAQLYAMDVNKDGAVNNRDAAMISRYLVGKETI